jgi:ABC-2 type transport system permease protein
MLAFARVALLRLSRDRTNLFFVLVLPMMLVLLLGLQFSGDGTSTVAVTDGDTSVTATVAGLDGVEVELYADAADVERAVAGGAVTAGIVLDGGQLVWLHRAGDAAPGLRSRLQVALDAANGDGQVADALATLGIDVPAPATQMRSVSTSMIGEPGEADVFAGLGRFDLGASGQLLLFVFVTSLAGSAVVIQVRRWGVLDRVLAGPTPVVTALGGLALGQLLVALAQALIIVVGTSVLFDVNWGDPVATGLVIVLFSLISTAAGLLLGALLRTDEQASALGVPLALALAAIGGSMVPLELFGGALALVSKLSPHSWGNLAFAEIVRRGGGVTDVLPQLGALLAFAVVLGTAAVVALWRRLEL